MLHLFNGIILRFFDINTQTWAYKTLLLSQSLYFYVKGIRLSMLQTFEVIREGQYLILKQVVTFLLLSCTLRVTS